MKYALYMEACTNIFESQEEKLKLVGFHVVSTVATKPIGGVAYCGSKDATLNLLVSLFGPYEKD